MTAASQERGFNESSLKRRQFSLAANKTAYKGAMACLDLSTGKVVPGAASTTLMHIGSFAETKTTGGTAALVDVDLDVEIRVRAWANGGTTVAATDVGKICYILDDQTVTMDSSGHSPAGRVWGLDPWGNVLVEVDHVDDLASVSVAPQIQSGTSTLVAGTKTISGVSLSASSRIFLTMKDPGAGAITGMAGLDAPAGSRNTGAGTFVVNAIDDAKAVITTAVCTFDYLIVG